MSRFVDCLARDHDLRLVALAAAICALGCFTSVLLRERAKSSPRLSVHLLSGIAFSLSVWSLHFVAMLSFLPAQWVWYNVDSTIFSMAVIFVFAVAAWGLFEVIRPPLLKCVTSGTVLAAGIAGMHYVGVSAMRESVLLFYDSSYIASSIVMAVTLSIVAFYRSLDTRSFGRKLEVSLWLALAICSLHFTGMSGLTVSSSYIEQPSGTVLGSETLAILVVVAALLLLMLALLAIGIEIYLTDRAHREMQRMRIMGDLAQEALILHRDGTVLETNSAAERLFERPARDMVGEPLTKLFHEDSIPTLARRAICPVEKRRPEQMFIASASGKKIAVEMSCQPIELFGKVCTAIALRDLTERKRDEERMIYLARHDVVTNLPNRFNFEERLRESINIAAHEGCSAALLYIDLDRFKTVNDLHGHAAGDAVLKQVATRLLKVLDPSDTLARLGGDEFAAIMHCPAGSRRVANVATAIVDELTKAFDYDGKDIRIGGSVGIAIFPSDAADPASLLKAADTAMYRVKSEGRGSFKFFERSMDDELQSRHQLERDLRAACRNDEFVLHFQPMVNAISGEVETFEALIRWNSPDRGLVSPAIFIPLAEETGLIREIGEWVIDTACREAVRWAEPRRVSVNVSAVQIRNSDIGATVVSALERHGLAPTRLVIEITESVLISDKARTLQALELFRAMGVRVALDDFGTGYSSLNYLQSFKFDKLKIDKSFVDKLAHSESSATIVKAIVNLGHNLELQVTAEGVETAEQLSLLRSLGCNQMQGYLFSKPKPISDFSEADFARIRRLFQRRTRPKLVEGVA